MGDDVSKPKKPKVMRAAAWRATDLPKRLLDCLRQLHILELLSAAEFRRRVVQLRGREAKGKYLMPPPG